MSKKMQLISFKLCPFVQRAVIVLLYKSVEFDISYVDLSNPPDWFKEISPLGQVPLLKVADEVLFESSVIQEYVDEVTPPSLHPSDPLAKAKNRAWISFGGELFMLQYGWSHAKSEKVFQEKAEQLQAKLMQLENAHSGQSYFNGKDFALIDAAYAPLFMRYRYISELSGMELLQDCPKLSRWLDNLLALDCVQQSVVEEFEQMFKDSIVKADGYIAKLLDDNTL